MARRRGHRDLEPNYLRRLQRKCMVAAGIAALVVLGVAYITFDAFAAEREEWWLGMIGIASLVPVGIFLAGCWRGFDAR